MLNLPIQPQSLMGLKLKALARLLNIQHGALVQLAGLAQVLRGLSQCSCCFRFLEVQAI